MGGGGKKGGDQTIGYEYYLGIDFSWCHGPADRITALFVDNREVFRGCLRDQETTFIDKSELFGEIEGGIRGNVDAEFGAGTQAANTYTVSQTGENTPAYRGITRTVFRGKSEDGSSRSCYLGNNPYLKRITGEVQRIYKRIQDGAVVDQWQKNIAGVPLIDPDAATLGFATGTIADQSIFINVDLSSASNGFTGKNGTIIGNGLGIEDIRTAIIDSLIDIRDNMSFETGVTEDFLGNETAGTGLDIGIGYVRFTTGDQNNLSNNPNDLDPNDAPLWNENNVPDQNSQWNLPKRGWIMKENATTQDINDLIEYVRDFVVVPDINFNNIPGESRELMKLMYNNADEAFASLSTSKLRGHIAYSGFVTDESEGTILGYAEDFDDLLDINNGGNSPIKAVYTVDGAASSDGTSIGSVGSSGSQVAAQTLGLPVGYPSEGLWTLGGGWYLIANDSEVSPDDGPLYMNTTGDANFDVGDRDLVDLPSGDAADTLFAIPENSAQTWYFGPRINSGIYAGRFDVIEHWQRDDTGESSVILNRGYEEYTWAPYNDVSKFTIDSTDTDGPAAALWLQNICGGYVEMNPAHIIRECLTDQQWGLGLPEADVDETSFASAAQTLYDELFGLSIAWTKETPIEDFINSILNHIDAVLYVDRTDGLWHLVLIRDDYDPDLLDTYTDADVVDWSEISIKSPAELTNSVTIKYNNRDLEGPASLTVNNLAQIQKLGKIVPTTVNYPGIWQDTLAARVAQRDLITLSTSLIAGEIVLTRKAYDMAPGDVFKLSSSRYNLSGEVMRVVEVNVGDGRQNAVRVKFTQDKYNFDFSEATDLVDPPDSEFDGPSANNPAIVENRVVTEEPYYIFVNRNGEILAEEIETQQKEIGYIFASAEAPTNSSVYARLYYDDGGGYVNGRQIAYGPSAKVGADIREEADKTTLTVKDFTFFEDVSVNDLIQINEEIMTVDSIDSTTQITVGRGALDTVPAFHEEDDTIFFISSASAWGGNEWVLGDTIDVKLLDSTNSGLLDPVVAPTDTVTMAARITGPYPVGQFQLDGSYRGVWEDTTGHTISATWVHRDRTQQNSSAPPTHTDAGIGPETNVNYTISAVAYDTLGQEITSLGDLFSVDKNQNTSHTITTSDYQSSDEFEPWSAVGVRVKTTREDSTSDQYDNWQTAEVIAYRQLEPNELGAEYDASWMDVNVIGSMYQDTSKNTSVASDGDPVALIENQKDNFL